MPPEVPFTGFSAPVEKALRAAYASADGDDENPKALLELAYVLHAHDQHRAALAAYERSLYFEKAFPAAYGRALALQSLGRADEAITAYADALKLRSDFTQARLRMAELQVERNLHAVAADEFRAVVKFDPENARAFYGLGRALNGLGQFDQALEALQTAVRLVPAYGGAHYALAQIYQKLKDSISSQKHFALHSQYGLIAPNLDDEILAEIRKRNAGALALIRQAADLTQRGDRAGAIQLLQEAVKLEPNQVQAHVNLIVLYAGAGKPFDAEQHFRLATQLAPQRSDAYYNFGVMQYGLGKIGEACAAFKRAIDIQPRYAEALTSYGICLEREGKIDQALATLRAAIDAKPSYRFGAFHLARVLSFNRRHLEAIPLLENIQAPVDRETPGFALALGTVYAQAGRREDARRAWESAVSMAISLNQPAIEAQARSMLARNR